MNDNLIKTCLDCENRQSICNGPCLCIITQKDILYQVNINECPIGKFNSIIVESKPFPTSRQIMSFAQALVVGKKVSLEIIKERTNICKKCEFARQTDSGDMWCGQCGCSVSSNDKKIQNLAAYEENLPRWGCKYPDRNKGGWPKLPPSLPSSGL